MPIIFEKTNSLSLLLWCLPKNMKNMKGVHKKYVTDDKKSQLILKQILTCNFAALITIFTPPPGVVAFLSPSKSNLSSNKIRFRQKAISDSCRTFTSSFETVSRFFSINPCDSYWTVSEKCFTRKAEHPKRGLSNCLYLVHFSINFETQDSSDPEGIYKKNVGTL